MIECVKNDRFFHMERALPVVAREHNPQDLLHKPIFRFPIQRRTFERPGSNGRKGSFPDIHERLLSARSGRRGLYKRRTPTFGAGLGADDVRLAMMGPPYVS